jgi:hypothetical protein
MGFNPGSSNGNKTAPAYEMKGENDTVKATALKHF